MTPETPTHAASADEIKFLRHVLATLAYRAEKALRDFPLASATQRIGPKSRTALEIAGHLGDLLEWACALTQGEWTWKASSAGDWNADVERFFSAMAKLDARLASGEPLGYPATMIFQAPIADALTHVGQLAMLRGIAGAPVKPESFAKAEIATGRVGRDQSAKRKEFDGDASGKR